MQSGKAKRSPKRKLHWKHTLALDFPYNGRELKQLGVTAMGDGSDRVVVKCRVICSIYIA